MLKKRKNKDYGAIGNLLTGLLVCTVMLFAFMLIATTVLYLGDDPTYKSELWSFGALLLSGAASGAFICRMQRGGLGIAALSALELVLILFLIAIFSSGIPSLPTVVNYAVYIAVSSLTAFFVSRKPRKRHRR